uniref:ADF-H domain-containing protein n=2 Tax=Pinguiococcus pyrenoidosus TaxID=172671 RepID=A0A7R9YEV0_9STRA|mmetsp:Transcript_7858/g.29449  ORF Transcript_7858/g.29449 Transcript_7858/m.29449 type:complete len:342 (+) Transcript_7858:109-1134(+)
MARANLIIDEELKAAFAAAQHGDFVRHFLVTIQGETLTLTGSTPPGSSVAEDFESLASALDPDSAAFVIFCLAEDVRDGAREWLLVAWVPDTAPVRQKMLFSSSRDDIKSALGRALFAGDYYANSADDLKFSQYQSSQPSAAAEAPLTEAEILRKEAATADMQSSHVTKASAMGVVPFNFTDDTLSSMDDFRDGRVSWVEIELIAEEEKVSLVSSGDKSEPYNGHVNAEEPRFIFIRVPRGANGNSSTTFFLLSVPEGSPVKLKMLMATARNTVLAECSARSLSFDKTIEVGDVNDVDSTIEWEINPPKDLGVSSAAAAITSAKPAAPRGRRPRTNRRGRK